MTTRLNLSHLLENIKHNNYDTKNFRENAEVLSGDNTLSVDHYHYFSHDDLRGGDIVGVARTMEFHNGNYTGSFCHHKQLRRTAISEHKGSKDNWDFQNLRTANVRIGVNI